MIDILLMVVIGGMGTMYGAVVGATLFIIAQNYLKELMARARGDWRACRCCRPVASRPLAAVARRAVRALASTSSRPASSASCRQARSGESRPRPSRAA